MTTTVASMFVCVYYLRPIRKAFSIDFRLSVRFAGTCNARITPRLHLIHVARIQVVYPLVFGYKLLVRDTSIRLHVSGVNAA